MKSGKEMLFEMAVSKICENLPPEVIDNVVQMAQTVAGFRAQLDRIEAQNSRILELLDGADTDRFAKPTSEFPIERPFP